MLKKEMIESLKKIGYVTRDEAALLTGRQPGGNIPEVFEKYGVRYLSISGKRDCRVYLKEDLEKVLRLKKANDIDELELTLDLAHNKIKELEKRVAKIESRFNQKWEITSYPNEVTKQIVLENVTYEETD